MLYINLSHFKHHDGLTCTRVASASQKRLLTLQKYKKIGADGYYFLSFLLQNAQNVTTIPQKVTITPP